MQRELGALRLGQRARLVEQRRMGGGDEQLGAFLGMAQRDGAADAAAGAADRGAAARHVAGSLGCGHGAVHCC
jgi:hypothetical protein